MTNAEIAAVFQRIAMILDLKGSENPFRIRAYERAAMMIENLPKSLKAIYETDGLDALQKLPGIGEDLALKIEEMLQTGALTYLTKVEKSVPEGLLKILEIEGMGPKKTKFVWQTFRVKSIPELQKIAESGKLTTLKGWGEKSVANILRGIGQRERMSGRLPLPQGREIADSIVEALKKSGLADRLEIAGSMRRGRETIGDIDILATSNRPEELIDVFVSLPQVSDITARGPTKSTVFLRAGLDCDIRVVEPQEFGAALLYFTGSKDHNVHLRKIGISKGLTLNEYGLHKGSAKKKGDLVAGKSEEDVYKALGLTWIPPEIREDRGEIEASLKKNLPDLIELGDINGDLHLHSTFSDGSASMEDMAAAAREKGLSYIAMTDHASPMGMVKGIKKTGSSLKDYLDRIAAARKKVKGIHILAGAEVDIMQDGSLYLDDDQLKMLDWVVASVHQHFHQGQDAGTKRLIKAVQNPYVHTIGHMTTRLLGRREGIALDIETILKAAKEFGTCVEHNASYERLDLNDTHLKRAKELGVKVTIGSDAHSVNGFDLRFGVSQARRGWVEKGDCVNCLSWKEFEDWLGSKR